MLLHKNKVLKNIENNIFIYQKFNVLYSQKKKFNCQVNQIFYAFNFSIDIFN